VPVTLHVELVVPDREIWSGSARMVIAKTPDGDMGILTSHPPVLSLLVEGSLVRILDTQAAGSDAPDAPAGSAGSSGDQSELIAAVSGGFFSVAEDRVSILAHDAQLASDIDVPATRAEIEAAEADAAAGEEPAGVKYARARLRAAGEQA
jgi:F-type H+-transporting ATPase subunit epsilon